jgi:hypothetical protein
MHFVCDWFSRFIPMVNHVLRLESSNSLKRYLFKKQSSGTYVSVGMAESFLANKTCEVDLDKIFN